MEHAENYKWVKHVSLACKALETTLEIESWLSSPIVIPSLPMKGVE